MLIAAATGRDALLVKALAVLNAPDREFITSVFVRMEVLPKAVYFRRPDEVAFYETFFASAQFVPFSEALDALHIAAAKASSVEEFITTERSTTALFRVIDITITSLRVPQVLD